MGKTSYRKRKRLGPLPVWINYSWSQTRGSHYSFSIKLGLWTYNTKSKTSTIDLPGGFKHRHQHGKSAAPTKAGARKATVKTDSTPPAPYRPARWPYAVLAVLLVLAVLGGAVWQAIVLFGSIALVLALVQRGRAQRAGTPADRHAVTSAEPGMDPDEAERIVRDWNPPTGWERDR